jgi:hypothetical protein
MARIKSILYKVGDTHIKDIARGTNQLLFHAAKLGGLKTGDPSNMDREIYSILLDASSECNPIFYPKKVNMDEETKEEDLMTLFQYSYEKFNLTLMIELLNRSNFAGKELTYEKN